MSACQAATDWIDNGGQVSNGIRLQRVGVRRGVDKSDGISGNFAGVSSESPTVGGGPYDNCFILSANSGWVYNRCRF